jgi:hypothetical protein
LTQGAFDSFAMGNYPYPSYYIGGTPDTPLPAWPMRVACAFLSEDLSGNVDALLEVRGLSTHQAVGVAGPGFRFNPNP